MRENEGRIVNPEVSVVFAPQEPPDAWAAAVFLAGPSPRAADVASWRPAAVAELRRRWRGPGRLVVFSPEPEDGWHGDYLGQVDWEERCLHLADEVVFYVPRDLDTLPGFTTNVEFGMWHASGRAVFGAPPDAPKNRYLLHHAVRAGMPVAEDLPGTLAAALERIGTGAVRSGGEREVPLLVWREPSFRHWYGAQRGAGNVLLGARLVWRLPVKDRPAAFWALSVRVRVAAEDRVKDGEVVLGRPDVSAVVLYRPGPTLDATEIVLVREFRAPGAAPDGFVHEPPGGSGPGAPPETALAEVAEETGLVLAADRLRPCGTRQVAATLSAHRAHVYAAEITDAELARLRAAGPHGVAADGEVTRVEITTYGELCRDGRADWSVLGMVSAALR
ncbi:hypothetical protein BTM25_25080 [Actinomadura rubteroloni]|uniref:NUDIX hydrolase n=1 Tax=Actinomadura rubteroloni TaxID=1926885 RepID=A0A2P4UFR5_9ACTN|nr:nucleoside 2-deoxyribosyltransferase domain-containing protein [Actinomadura rubteroloni]POM23882.1 hypothetical protein BTM25_25080 [Actinomadura rubteroloni]